MRFYIVILICTFSADIFSQVMECPYNYKALQYIDTSYADSFKKYDFPMGIEDPINPTSSLSDSSYFTILNYILFGNEIQLKLNGKIKEWMAQYSDYWDYEGNQSCNRLCTSDGDKAEFSFSRDWRDFNSMKYIDANNSEHLDTCKTTLELRFTSRIDTKDKRFSIIGVRYKDVTGSIYSGCLFIFENSDEHINLIDFRCEYLF